MILAVLYSNDASYFRMRTKTPFRRPVLNKAYSCLSCMGAEKGIKVIFARWDKVSGGRIDSYWEYDKKWKKKKGKVKPDYFFDKFDLGKKQNLLRKRLSSKEKIINNYKMEMFCKDKYAQAKAFPETVPRTFLVRNKNELEKACKKLFPKKAILKPRYGLGGIGIKVFSTKNEKKPAFRGNHVLQEMVDTSGGIPRSEITGVHDYRCVIVNGKIIYSYVREPKKGLLANIHQGGTAKFVSVPKALRRHVERIDCEVKKFGNRVYSADFVFGKPEGKKKRFFLIELNSKPGFDVCHRFGYGETEKKFLNEIFKMLGAEGGKRVSAEKKVRKNA